MSQDYQLRPDRDLTILIPARAGSKRCPGKNTRMLGGKPLILWTIEAAEAANAAKIIVSSDDGNALDFALQWGHDAHSRKPEHATDESPDYYWVADVLERVTTPHIAICRPTSPFRTASTIRRGYAQFCAADTHSLRAVERVVNGHPGKMWVGDGRYIIPLMNGHHRDGTPFHSSPTQTLPTIYRQNACLEIVHKWVVEQMRSISGTHIVPFFTDAEEGVNIDTEADFREAEQRLTASTRP